MSVVRNGGLVIWIFVLSLCVSATAQQKTLWQGIVKLGAVNVYQSASTSEHVTTTLKQGEVVNVVLEINVMGDAWCRIAFSGHSEPLGYVLCFNLEQGRVAPRNAGRNIPVATTPTTTETQSGLTNQDILLMVRAGFSDSAIIKEVGVNNTNFDISVPSLLALKKAGASEPVIEAMFSVSPGNKTQGAPVPQSNVLNSPDFADEVGVYARKDGRLVAIEPEVVNWRTGGVLKNAATLGLDKGHLNGTVAGPHSSLTLPRPSLGMAGQIEIIIRCAEGNSASEYQLLRFWQKSDRREFRAVTGGILHASGGAVNNEVTFKYEKIAPRTYKIELPSLQIGEFGFLAPGGMTSSNIASQGKIYTFRILE